MSADPFNSSASNNTLSYGWKSSPSGRGTSSILTSCLLTIFLCCWSSVCPNVSALSDTKWDRLHDKITLACIALLGPEFLLGIAAGQMTSAAESVKEFQQNGLSDWTLTHAFYADMGGFVLKIKQGSKEITFPVNSKQLFYLINKGYLEYPQLREEDIQDKNKADSLARLITVVQATWFFVSTVARGIQGLAISTLELTTMSFIVIMFITSFYWIHKPLDVATPTIIFCTTTIEEIHSNAGLVDAQWAYTPLDFVSRREYSLGKIWAYYSQIMKKLHLPLYSRHVTVRPRDRIPSDTWLKPDLLREFVPSVFMLAFVITLVAAWNFTFPTPIERTLWRAATAFNIVFTVFGGGYVWFWEYVIPKMQKSRAPPSPQIPLRQTQEPPRRTFAKKLRNISSPLDPELEISLAFLIPISLLCALYCVCRIYIFVEDFIGLRSLPVSAFQTIEWAEYIPHL